MEYHECVMECIMIAQKELRAWQVPYLAAYPQPSPQEWASCLQEVAESGKEVTDPQGCLERYEQRLARRGIQTVPQLLRHYTKIAKRNGVPKEHLHDSINLFVMRHADTLFERH